MRQRKPKQYRRHCSFCKAGIREIDYKKTDLLRPFLDKKGAIESREPSWVRRRTKNADGTVVKHPTEGKWAGGTGLCRKHQNQLARAVKNARFMALLPYEVRHFGKAN